jgi:adenosylcobinamide kinase/adenosylcobinamide-phosphate guanylyltransferase
MGQITLLLGGARSGKSTFAQKLAAEHGGRVVFVATAQPGDPEMVARIAAHQNERPTQWTTLESPIQVARNWRNKGVQADIAILDCMTFLITNLILQATEDIDHPDEARAEALVRDEIQSLLELVHETTHPWIVVSNEVGLGLVPPYPLGRIFRDTLGWANQRLAAIAGEVYLLIAGIPVPIHSFRS